ncbi:hypothetical protein JK359_12450 [Streptomyces actinomycinicus]|uniref:Secreted protein n=1 Tax=Streptomyces actinomycinicus TaxID=1695166 RepID=A0A937JNU8_9ACTN|nr:hypothetical protein [Streptomyces actinomycinicus]MBL1082782.1 hypothetical protein [Streptomyces actinomycinicus]
MKKRSMLAIASLATGFVVAAVTPSHAADDGLLPTPSHAAEDGLLGDLHVADALDGAGRLVSQDSLGIDDDAGQE